MAKKRQDGGSVLDVLPEERQPSLNIAVYEMIKADIVSSKLRPGIKLTHQGLAERLSVSRTPVREALERLFQEGYVSRDPGRGFFVAEIDAQNTRDLYQLREALELFQLRRLFDRGISAAELANLRAINQRYEKLILKNLTAERLMVDREFHMTLASFCGNAVLLRHLDSIFERLILKRKLEGAIDRSGIAPFEEHVALLDAIEQGQQRQAQAILRKHIRGACIRLIEHIEMFSLPEPVRIPRRSVRSAV